MCNILDLAAPNSSAAKASLWAPLALYRRNGHPWIAYQTHQVEQRPLRSNSTYTLGLPDPSNSHPLAPYIEFWEMPTRHDTSYAIHSVVTTWGHISRLKKRWHVIRYFAIWQMLFAPVVTTHLLGLLFMLWWRTLTSLDHPYWRVGFSKPRILQHGHYLHLQFQPILTPYFGIRKSLLPQRWPRNTWPSCTLSLVPEPLRRYWLPSSSELEVLSSIFIDLGHCHGLSAKYLFWVTRPWGKVLQTRSAQFRLAISFCKARLDTSRYGWIPIWDRNTYHNSWKDKSASLMAPHWHLSQEIHQRMVAWSQELGKSNTEIAQLAACSEHTVRDVLRLEREFGVVYNPLAHPGDVHAYWMLEISHIFPLSSPPTTLYTSMKSIYDYYDTETSMCPYQQ
jgi:hypothetical protein